MSEEQYPPIPEESEPSPPNDATRASEVTPMQRRPRELPRRGYEGQPRPMNPPPPPPVTTPPIGRTVPPEPAYPPPASPYQRPIARAGDYDVIPPQSRSVPRPRRLSKSDSGLYLPWWSLVILVVVAGGGAFGLLYAVISLSVGQNPGDQPPRFIVVTNPVSDTQSGGSNQQTPINPGAIPPTFASAPSAVPLAPATQTPFPGVTTGCPLNAQVEVVGTDGLPLIIRDEPRQGDNVQSLAAVGERLRIIEGPQTSTDVNGEPLEWCKIEGVTVPGRSGWAARQFLGVVQE